MYKFNFTSKAQYLQQKKEWHDAFIFQIRKIRALKNDIKVAQRQHESVYPAMRAVSEAHEELRALLDERSNSRAMAYKQMMADNPNAISFHEKAAA